MALNADQKRFADALAARWDALALWASGCPVSDFTPGENDNFAEVLTKRTLREQICKGQGAANLAQTLKKEGARPQIEHWFKDANPRRNDDKLEETELDVLGSELKLVEDAAKKHGFKADGAGERMIPPPRTDEPSPWLAHFASVRIPGVDPSPQQRKGFAGAFDALGTLGRWTVVGTVAVAAGLIAWRTK